MEGLQILDSDPVESESTICAGLNLKDILASDKVNGEVVQKADVHLLRTVAAGAVPPSLPPSVEEAYRKKCIELKRRMTEVEESNDSYRLRKIRLQRGIRKMRLERAYLFEILGKRMKKNGGSIDEFQGVYHEDSEGSSEAPPTPNEKPLRSKRSHRRPVSSPPPMAHQQHRPLAPSQMHSAPAFEPPRDRFRELQYQHVPTTNGHLPLQYQPPHPSNIAPNPISPTAAPPLRHAPAPPINAFDSFVMQHVLPNQERYRFRSEDEGVALAKKLWQDQGMEQVRAMFVESYESNFQRYREELLEFERGMEREAFEQQRGRELEGQRELPPPPPSRDGGGGGFTSING